MNDPGLSAVISGWVTLDGPLLLIAFLLMLGYALKLMPETWFPNDRIPLAIMGVGPVLSLFLVGYSEPGKMPPNIPFPEAAALIQALCRGFILSAFTWMFHAAALKRMEKFIASKLSTGDTKLFYKPIPGDDQPRP